MRIKGEKYNGLAHGNIYCISIFIVFLFLIHIKETATQKTVYSIKHNRIKIHESGLKLTGSK